MSGNTWPREDAARTTSVVAVTTTKVVHHETQYSRGLGADGETCGKLTEGTFLQWQRQQKGWKLCGLFLPILWRVSQQIS